MYIKPVKEKVIGVHCSYNLEVRRKGELINYYYIDIFRVQLILFVRRSNAHLISSDVSQHQPRCLLLLLGMQTRITDVFSELHTRRLSGDFRAK
jgi:hypothetical protein